MIKRKSVDSSVPPRKTRPALNPGARENQLISRAYDLVEKRLMNGTASSQETTHFLKMGSMKEKYERENLAIQNKLLEAKIDALQSAQRSDELYANALKAMRNYSGQAYEEEDDDEFDEE